MNAGSANLFEPSEDRVRQWVVGRSRLEVRALLDLATHDPAVDARLGTVRRGLEDLLEDPTGEPLASPFLGGTVTRTLRHLTAGKPGGSAGAAQDIAILAALLAEPLPPLSVTAGHPLAVRILQAANAAPRNDRYPAKNLSPVTSVPSQYVELIGELYRGVRVAWPELHAEMCATVAIVAPFRGVPLGFTDASAPGLIFIQYRPDDPAFALEHVVHEAGHAYLNLAARQTGLFQGLDGARVASPWRRDPRPMSGVIHGMFVFARLLVLGARLAARSDRANLLADKADVFEEQFNQAYETVTRCELTDPVAALVGQMRTAVDERPPRMPATAATSGRGAA